MDSFIELKGPFGLRATIEKYREHNGAESCLPRYPKLLEKGGVGKQVNSVAEEVLARNEGFREEGE